MVWTSTLGPPAVLVWRRLAGTLLQEPNGFILYVAELAQALGIRGVGNAAPVTRTLRRPATFGMARFVDGSTYAVRRHIPRLSTPSFIGSNQELHRLHRALLARHDTERLERRAELPRGA